MDKRKIIISIICGLLICLFGIMISYAFWQLTKKQTDINVMESACLDFELINVDDNNTSLQAYNMLPINDFEGMKLVGYQFVVKNKCPDPTDYRIDLNSLETTEKGYISDSAVALLLDNGVKTLYSDFASEETTEDGVREKRILAYDTVMGNSTNTHTLRMWIDEKALIDEQNKMFLSNIEIKAGQGIKKNYTPEECFTFDASTGTITNYDVTCGGTDVVIPYAIKAEGYDEPVAVNIIGSQSFGNKGLTSVEVPRSVTKIDMAAFWKNTNLSKVVLKDSLLNIGTSAFAGGTSSSLKSIIIPNTVTNIGQSAFQDNLIEQLIIPDSVKSVGQGAFKNNKIKNLIIGNGLSIINSFTFASNSIEQINIPDNITSIGDRAFIGNHSDEINLGNGLTSIGSYAFDGTNISSLIVPANVTSIDDHAFTSAPNLHSVTIKRADASGITLNSPFDVGVTINYEP